MPRISSKVRLTPSWPHGPDGPRRPQNRRRSRYRRARNLAGSDGPPSSRGPNRGRDNDRLQARQLRTSRPRPRSGWNRHSPHLSDSTQHYQLILWQTFGVEPDVGLDLSEVAAGRRTLEPRPGLVGVAVGRRFEFLDRHLGRLQSHLQRRSPRQQITSPRVTSTTNRLRQTQPPKT